MKINDKPIIVHTLELFQKHEQIDKIYIAIHPDYYEYMQDLVKFHYITKTAGIVKGGATGQDSIYNALVLARKENSGDSIVLIHDGVRPNITQDVISRNIECASKNGNAITCTSCFETILISDNNVNPKTVPYRKNTYSAQAPQSFILDEILEAHEITREKNPDYVDIVDSCTLYNMLGRKVFMVNGNKGNLKVTDPIDYHILCGIIEYLESENKDMVPKDAYARRRTKKDYE